MDDNPSINNNNNQMFPPAVVEVEGSENGPTDMVFVKTEDDDNNPSFSTTTTTAATGDVDPTPSVAALHRYSTGSLNEKMEHQNCIDHNNSNSNSSSNGILTASTTAHVVTTTTTSVTTTTSFTLVAKFGKERIQLSGLSPEITIGQVKDALHGQTRILPKRQKLVGLAAATAAGVAASKGGQLPDDLPLSQIKVKKTTTTTANDGPASSASAPKVITLQFILMGTPEEEIFVDPHIRGDDLPDVIDDFDLDFNAGSEEWLQHVENKENLKRFTAQTAVHIMNPPRENKPLLVLDLDHTLLDFSARTLQRDGSSTQVGQGVAAAMKRPFMDEFLSQCYEHYDLVVWSQTSWRWLETKLTELGMLTHPGYRFCFVLDKTSMFTITSEDKKGKRRSHHVKPLQIIWTKFEGRWGPTNTVHLDDLQRNFALNRGSGLLCTAYHRRRNPRDCELVGLGQYLVRLAQANVNFEIVDFGKWNDVVQGKCPLVDESQNNKSLDRKDSKPTSE